jgi:hypothetical protein
MTNNFNVKGYSKTIVQTNSGKNESSVQVDANYDGRKANVDLKVNKNGKRKHINVDLTRKDMMELLNTHPVPGPLDMRLHNDFGGVGFGVRRGFGLGLENKRRRRTVRKRASKRKSRRR